MWSQQQVGCTPHGLISHQATWHPYRSLRAVIYELIVRARQPWQRCCSSCRTSRVAMAVAVTARERSPTLRAACWRVSVRSAARSAHKEAERAPERGEFEGLGSQADLRTPLSAPSSLFYLLPAPPRIGGGVSAAAGKRLWAAAAVERIEGLPNRGGAQGPGGSFLPAAMVESESGAKPETDCGRWGTSRHRRRRRRVALTSCRSSVASAAERRFVPGAGDGWDEGRRDGDGSRGCRPNSHLRRTSPFWSLAEAALVGHPFAGCQRGDRRRRRDETGAYQCVGGGIPYKRHRFWRATQVGVLHVAEGIA